MILDGATCEKVVDNMSLNTCKVIIKNTDQPIVSKGVSCTKDVELYIFMLTCPR
jgi:hypothetical protein